MPYTSVLRATLRTSAPRLIVTGSERLRRAAKFYSATGKKVKKMVSLQTLTWNRQLRLRIQKRKKRSLIHAGLA